MTNADKWKKFVRWWEFVRIKTMSFPDDGIRAKIDDKIAELRRKPRKLFEWKKPNAKQ